MKLHGPLTRYVKLQVAHAPGMPGTFSSSPITNETASKRSRHPSRHVRRARVVMHVGITNPRWPVKCSRHSRRMYNPQSLRIWREAHGIHGSRFTGQSTVYSKLNMEPISLNIFHRNSNTVKTKFSSNFNYGGKFDCETGPKMTTTKASKLFIAGRFLWESRIVHDDVIKWKHFPLYWPFVRGIHRSLVNFPHKGQWRWALVFSLICALNKRLSKQSWGWWFETPSRPLCWNCFHVTANVIKCTLNIATYYLTKALYW